VFFNTATNHKLIYHDDRGLVPIVHFGSIDRNNVYYDSVGDGDNNDVYSVLYDNNAVYTVCDNDAVYTVGELAKVLRCYLQPSLSLHQYSAQ
jgi:hypothetical protein